MPKLVSMKKPKKTKKEMETACSPMMEQEKYPYGLRITFHEDEIKKLPGLKKLKAGDMVQLAGKGKVKVVEVRDTDDESRSSQRVEIQLHDVAVEPASNSDYGAGFDDQSSDKK